MSKIVVLGGGAAGTAAAYRLGKLGHNVTILEKQSELGGRIKSQSYKGTTIEMGASFLSKKLYTDTFSVVNDSLLKDDLRQRNRVATFLRDGVEHTPRELLSNSWLSWDARKVLIKELLHAFRNRQNLDLHKLWLAAKYDNQSVTNVFTNNANLELLDYFIQPVLSGFFYDPPHVSNALLMLLLNTVRQLGKSYTLGNGLQQIPNYMSSQSNVLTDAEVVESIKRPNGTYSVHINHKGHSTTLDSVDGIICAVTASVVPQIISNLTNKQRDFFSVIGYSTTVVAARCYVRDRLHDEHTVGFPVVENGLIAAASSHSALNYNNENIEIIKLHGSGVSSSNLVNQADEVIIKTLQNPEKLGTRVLDKSAPDHIFVQRWPEALPEFKVGHLKNIEKFHNGEIEALNDHTVFAGDYLGGPFVEGAIASGFQAANRLHLRLS